MNIAPVSPAAHLRAASGAAAPDGGFGAALRARRPLAAPGRPSPPDLARTALAAVDRARARLDGVLAAARRGQTFTPQELLALQADAYRYSQTVEIASRVVEQGVQSVKQAVNAQV